MNQTKEFSLTLMAKNKTKKFPLFYGICRFILNPGFRFYPSRRNKLLKEIEKTKDNLVLNIGSGCFKISDATTIINTDISAFEQASGNIGSRDRTQKIAGDYY